MAAYKKRAASCVVIVFLTGGNSRTQIIWRWMLQKLESIFESIDIARIEP
jgi:hypothetical protein